RDITLSVWLMANLVPLTEIFDLDDRTCFQITSAKTRSVLRKCQSPVPKRMTTRIGEMQTTRQSSAASPRRRHQRKPSITPTMGFKEYNKRHFSGTMPLLKPTGETYNPNCTMKGTM